MPLNCKPAITTLRLLNKKLMRIWVRLLSAVSDVTSDFPTPPAHARVQQGARPWQRRPVARCAVRAAQEKARVDVAVWGGLVPANARDSAELGRVLAKGAVGLKAFLCPSGSPEFEHVDRCVAIRDDRLSAIRVGWQIAVGNWLLSERRVESMGTPVLVAASCSVPRPEARCRGS
jgi:hypothetical protein